MSLREGGPDQNGSDHSLESNRGSDKGDDLHYHQFLRAPVRCHLRHYLFEFTASHRSTNNDTIRVHAEQWQIKTCCATLYESDLARFLLGDSFHRGGLAIDG